ncbi:hypothetical protein ACS0TY_016028 [Phlomoides rotata]
MEMGWKPNVEVSPPCPRCGSSNTKFCYYNNYSLTQPRYFCKSCRRYWTKGGSLRNVPVGGGCRKTRRAPKSTRLAGSGPERLEPRSVSALQETSTTSNIDLAAVYANFVNHAPPPVAETASYLHGGAIDVPSIEFSIINLSSSTVPPEMNGYFACEQFPATFPVGFDGFQTGSSFMSMNIPMGNDLLPPFPGEEVWPNSDAVLQNQIMNDQEMIGGGEENMEVGNGNMSMFSGLNLEAIFRT